MTAIITRTVWLLSFVRLFTDMASEMLYPVMPVYLQSIGFSVILIGILEGVAEATAGLSKGYFGSLSDSMGKRLPFVRAGYALSVVEKPMLAVLIHPLWVFASRTLSSLHFYSSTDSILPPPKASQRHGSQASARPIQQPWRSVRLHRSRVSLR